MKLFLIGLPGSGKSYWAKKLSTEINLPPIDLDEEIEKLAKKSIADIFSESGEQQFRLLEHQSLKQVCSSSAQFILACGGGTPCFHKNLEIIHDNGVSIYLKYSVRHIMKNLENQAETVKRPLLDQESLFDNINTLLRARASFYEKADHIIDMDRLQQHEVLIKLKTLLKI